MAGNHPARRHGRRHAAVRRTAATPSGASRLPGRLTACRHRLACSRARRLPLLVRDAPVPRQFAIAAALARPRVRRLAVCGDPCLLSSIALPSSTAANPRCASSRPSATTTACTGRRWSPSPSSPTAISVRVSCAKPTNASNSAPRPTRAPPGAAGRTSTPPASSGHCSRHAPTPRGPGGASSPSGPSSRNSASAST